MRFLTVFVLFMGLLSTPLIAQQGGSDSEPTDNLHPMQKQLLPYPNPLGLGLEISEQPAERELEPVELTDRESLAQMAEVYRIYLDVLNARIDDDLVSAEEGLREAVSELHWLLDTRPDLREERRFVELYRSVVAEYRDFYNVTGSLNEVEGEVFDVQEELWGEGDDWVPERFDLPVQIRFDQTEIPLVQNSHVTRHLTYYTIRRPEVMDRWLERSEKYFPMMREIFEEEGVPPELIHLSMIESGLNPTARSWAAAVGLWQFIRPTGAAYGLEVNWWLDERRDPVKATRAAAQHLRDLYNIWGDWHLAMANYNISPRGLRRAINSAGGIEDYWAAYPYLPRETRGYVPGFIAATMIALHPEEFGFERHYGGEPWRYDVVEVEGLLSLDRLAEAAGITTQELREYNPELLRWATPPGDRYPLKIPTGIRQEFLANVERIPESERVDEVAVHTVSRGENLGQIARRYDTSVRSLYDTNESLSSTIHPGQRIMIPVASGSMQPIAADRPTNSISRRTSTSSSRQSAQVQVPANSTSVEYTVKSGDTVGHIAEWFGVASWQVRNWNGVGNIIRAGQKLTLHVPNGRASYYRQMDSLSFAEKQDLNRRRQAGEDVFSLAAGSGDHQVESGSGGTVTYTVQRNDTLIGIANSHGVSVAQIQRLNSLRGTRIYPGQTLRVRAGE
ncbi:MAG: LysM peptidoglycan-binding domain-containing protein [Balneolaceae bacterium]